MALEWPLLPKVFQSVCQNKCSLDEGWSPERPGNELTAWVLGHDDEKDGAGGVAVGLDANFILICRDGVEEGDGAM